MAASVNGGRKDHSAPPKPWVAGQCGAYHANHPAPHQIRGGREGGPMPRGGEDRAMMPPEGRREE